LVEGVVENMTTLTVTFDEAHCFGIMTFIKLLNLIRKKYSLFQ